MYITPHQVKLRVDLVPQRYIDKFHSRVDVNFRTGCWEWMGGHKQSKNKKNYGSMGSFDLLNGHRAGGPIQVLAHRLSWYIHYGEIPNDMDVCHTCDNPNCCNPEHLFLGTASDNMQDMVRKGRNNGPRGIQTFTNKLKDADVHKIREMRKQGISRQLIADKFGVNYSLIYKIDKGEAWKWLNE